MVLRSTACLVALMALAGCAVEDGSEEGVVQARVTTRCDEALEACLAKGEGTASCRQTHETCATAPLFFSNQTGE